jgi:hypothetical protein
LSADDILSWIFQPKKRSGEHRENSREIVAKTNANKAGEQNKEVKRSGAAERERPIGLLCRRFWPSPARDTPHFENTKGLLVRSHNLKTRWCVQSGFPYKEKCSRRTRKQFFALTLFERR